jgi:Mn-dependent DtxR family transcriptional regulator
MLRLLAVEGSLGNADICRRLGAKPSTVTNNFNELRDKSLVTKDGQKYTLTPYGAQVIPGLL